MPLEGVSQIFAIFSENLFEINLAWEWEGAAEDLQIPVKLRIDTLDSVSVRNDQHSFLY